MCRRHSVAISPVQVRSPVLPMIATDLTPPKNAPGADGYRFGFAADRDMPDGIVPLSPSNKIVHPIVGQRCRQGYAGFHQLGVNSIINVHVAPGDLLI